MSAPVQELAVALGDLIAPRHCLVCGRELQVNERHICIFCDADMPFTHYTALPNNPMADQLNALLERQCPAEDPPGEYVHAASLFYYNSETGYKYIPQALKYHGDLPAGRRFARLFGKQLAAEKAWREVDCVLPVPLHWTRRWRRGYNQAEILSREIARELGADCRTDMLRRKRATKTQTALSTSEKLRNVSSAFAVSPRFRPERLTYSHLLIVDDVCTTGATLCAAYRALRPVLPPEIRLSLAALASVV